VYGEWNLFGGFFGAEVPFIVAKNERNLRNIVIYLLV
jgi:hypothetical protein